jgi:hypothetical protein
MAKQFAEQTRWDGEEYQKILNAAHSQVNRPFFKTGRVNFWSHLFGREFHHKNGTAGRKFTLFAPGCEWSAKKNFCLALKTIYPRS